MLFNRAHATDHYCWIGPLFKEYMMVPGASHRNSVDLIRMIRMVKSAEEVQRLTRSAEINEQAAAGPRIHQGAGLNS